MTDAGMSAMQGRPPDPVSCSVFQAVSAARGPGAGGWGPTQLTLASTSCVLPGTAGPAHSFLLRERQTRRTSSQPAPGGPCAGKGKSVAWGWVQTCTRYRATSPGGKVREPWTSFGMALARQQQAWVSNQTTLLGLFPTPTTTVIPAWGPTSRDPCRYRVDTPTWELPEAWRVSCG